MALKIWSHEHIVLGIFSSHFGLSIFFLVSVLIVFNLAIQKSKSKSKTNQIPSPPKLPIIGNLHQLGTLPNRSFRDLSLKYGNMMMLQLGQRKTLVISSSSLAMEIMKNHDVSFSNRPQTIASKILFYGCTDIAFGVYGEIWKLKRKIIVLELLNTKSVQSFHRVREEEVANLVSKVRKASSNDACVNLSEMFTSITNNVICKCALGKKFEGDMKDIARNIMTHISQFVVGDYFPSLRWIDVLSGKIGKFKDTFRALDGLLDQVIEERLETMKRESIDEFKNNSKGFIDILLQLQQDGMLGFELSNNDLKGILADMFVGGTETSATTLEWTFSELMRHPSIMKKAQEEVRRVIGHKSKVEESDINEMQYLKCIVKETLRLHPPIPLNVPRETISNVTLQGYDIPAKTMVYINVWAIQRDPKNWKNPEEFMPERFEHNQIDFIGQDFELIPFGFGRRGCPGSNFSKAVIEYVLASLLYCFDWKLPAETNSGQEQDIDMSEIFGFVLSKKVPLYLKPISSSF